MVFEEGKYYQHTGGEVIHIVGTLNTFFYGNGLVAETDSGELYQVGSDEDSATNWHQVSGWPRSLYDDNSIPEPSEKQQHSEKTEGKS